MRIVLPKQAGGKRVKRTALRPEQVYALVVKLKEPYSTLVLFLYVTGLRIGEALALRWQDLAGNVITVMHRNYKEPTVSATDYSRCRDGRENSRLAHAIRK
jgi:integrase